MLQGTWVVRSAVASAFAIAAVLALSQEVRAADDDPESAFRIGGYARGWLSWNLQEQPERPGSSGLLSMARGAALLDADWKVAKGAKLKAVVRLDREYKTSYLESLEAAPNPFPGTGSTKDVFTTNAGGGIGGIMNIYNQDNLRELWGEAELTDRIKLKIGRQQIVWGETDFFRALDVVHGFDYRWRSFLEPENEELRKPLNLARMWIQVPEAKGSFDMFIRPGLDRFEDIGNTYDLGGGRWASQPAKGASFFYATGYNYRSEGADARDITGGIRWQGQLAGLNYSLVALSTFNNDPVFNPCPANMQYLYQGPGSSSAFSTFKQTPARCATNYNPFQPGGVQPEFGDWIFPKSLIFGATASGYADWADAVFSAEVVWQKDRSYNYGLQQGGRFGYNIIPGSFGIIQKDVLMTMFRMDKTVDLTSILGTGRPSFASVQLFNTSILDFDKNDEIVQLAFWSRAMPRNSAILTGILAMNYNNDRINPTIAAGWDATNAGGFVIPSVEFVLGDNWRLKAELDLFFPRGNEKTSYINPNTFAWVESGRGASLMGYFANNNQAMIRLTRQF